MAALTHYLRCDFRAVSLEVTINGLIDTIEVLKKQINEIHWYDGDWFMEESEPIYGLAFIAFQNYINGSIKDYSNSISNKIRFYKLGQKADGFSKSKIELVIGLANYSKHKDEGKLHKGTQEVLDCFNLNYKEISFLNNSAIFQGLTILNNDWDLRQIKKVVTDWRELLWTEKDAIMP